MPLLSSTDFPEIREKIGAGADDKIIPDTMISRETVKGAAEAFIAARTNDVGQHAKNAAVYYAAWLLMPVVADRMSVFYAANSGGTSQATRDPAKHMAWLRERVDAELALTSDSGSKDTADDQTVAMPAVFALASGTRGF